MWTTSGRAADFTTAADTRYVVGLGIAPPRRASPWLRWVLASALALGVAAGADAETRGAAFVPKYTGTLKKIAESGTVHIGYRENSPPFAFLDARKKPIGYSLDLCEIVVEEIAAELGKDIRAQYRPVTPENRFDLVDSGEIDLECGSTTNNTERRKIAAFSPTMFVTGTKLMVRQVVERAFQRLAGSREIVAIYERWFQKPLPAGARLNLPMSPHLEELFRVQGLPSD